MDHRFLLDENGKPKFLKDLNRRDRRRIESNGRKLAEKYRDVMRFLKKDGAGYPIDNLLRAFCIEYNHRYASSGTQTQPLNFNYFEPFCQLHLFENSVAPYILPREEIDFIFSIQDYFEFITSRSYSYDKNQLLSTLNNGQVYNFTQMGSVNDFGYSTSNGAEFLISGFSMLRLDNSLFWYLLGGERLSEEEWAAASADIDRPDLSDIPPEKMLFMSEALDEAGQVKGPPVCLEGTSRTRRTIIAGETDIPSSTHLARCYMAEYEQSFLVVSDDPDIFDHLRDNDRKSDMIKLMSERIEQSAVMWNLVESFFGLPSYLNYKIKIDKLSIDRSGIKPPRNIRGGHIAGGNVKYIRSIEITDNKVPDIQNYTPPLFHIETDGYWKRIDDSKFGYDKNNKLIKGRTWIKSENKWRDEIPKNRTIYAKSLISSAAISVQNIIDSASKAEKNEELSKDRGVLYTMRCMSMQEEIYKVGWTSRSAQERADELSAATGVPSSFVVVDHWKLSDPEAVEHAVHAMLLPYRVNDSREFFRVNYATLKSIIETEIGRSTRVAG